MATDREILESCLSDASKEAYGFRVRADVSDWTDAEIEAEIASYARFAAAERDRELSEARDERIRRGLRRARARAQRAAAVIPTEGAGWRLVRRPS